LIMFFAKPSLSKALIARRERVVGGSGNCGRRFLELVTRRGLLNRSRQN